MKLTKSTMLEFTTGDGRKFKLALFSRNWETAGNHGTEFCMAYIDHATGVTANFWNVSVGDERGSTYISTAPLTGGGNSTFVRWIDQNDLES